MRRRIIQFGLVLAGLTWPTLVLASTYGNGIYGVCTYGKGNCGASGGFLPNVGSKLLFFSSVGAILIAIGIVVYFVIRSRRKKHQASLSNQAQSFQIPTSQSSQTPPQNP